MKKLVSVVMILAMILCLGQAATMTASADDYDRYYYFLKFDGNGGKIDSANEPTTLLKKLTQTSLVAAYECSVTKAHRDGYTFLGWYTAASGGTKVTKSYVGTPGTVYAHWLQVNTETIKAGIEGKNAEITFTSTGGHTWTLDSLGTASEWVHVTKKSDSKYSLKIDPRSGFSVSNRVATLCFRDQYGNTFFVRVYQDPVPVETVRKRVNEAFGSERFYNVCVGTGKVSYEKKYAALFGNEYVEDGKIKFGTWCTDAAMMDLLNRKLEADGLLVAIKDKSYFFDIRDVITGMASNMSGNFDQFKVVQGGKKPHHATVTKGSFANGGEKCNKPGDEGKTSTFENKYGAQLGNAKKYTVQFKKPDCKISGFENPRTVKQEIKDLLLTRPEGVFIYSNAGGDHAMLIVGYDKATDSFRYVDNGNGGGVVTYSNTYFYSGHGIKSESTMLEKIFCIAYVR